MGAYEGIDTRLVQVFPRSQGWTVVSVGKRMIMVSALVARGNFALAQINQMAEERWTRFAAN